MKFGFFLLGVALCPWALNAQVDRDQASQVWKAEWHDPVRGVSASCSGDVEQGEDGRLRVQIWGGDGHEGGYDCTVVLDDDSTGRAGWCPLFEVEETDATLVGVRHVAGEALLVRFDAEGRWRQWLCPRPEWQRGVTLPLFDAWRRLAGTWEAVGDPLAPVLQISGQRPEVRWGSGWEAMSLVRNEMDMPLPSALTLGGQGAVAYRWNAQGQLVLTRLHDVGDNVVQWEPTGEVLAFRPVSQSRIAPFAEVPGQWPELSLAPVDGRMLMQPADVLRRMRNEVFARQGWRFSSEDLRSYFEAQAWYTPGEDNAAIVLTEVERFNTDQIRRREQALALALENRPDLAFHFGAEWAQFETAGLNPAVSADGTDQHWVLVKRGGQFDVVRARLRPDVAGDADFARGVTVEGADAEVVATFDPAEFQLRRVRHFRCSPELEPGVEVRLGEDWFISEVLQVQDEYRQLQFRRMEPDGRMTDVQPEGMWLEFPQRLEWAGDLNGDGRTDVILGSFRKASVTLFQFWVTNPMTGALELRAEKELSGC